MSHPDALVIEGLSVRIGGRDLLRHADARFAAGKVHAVIGRSGAGKSVLMKAACGLLPARAGTVRAGEVRAEAGDERAFARLRARVVFVHQEPALLDERTVAENLVFAARRRPDLSPQDVLARKERWLAALELEAVAHRRCDELSPGLLRRTALGRALCLAPEVLIVDEPTTGLDPAAATSVDAALSALARLGSTLIVVTHDLRSLERLSPLLTFVDEGTVAYQDSAEEKRDEGAAIAVHPPAMAALLAARPWRGETSAR